MQSNSSGPGRNFTHCRIVFAVAVVLGLVWPASELRAQEEKAPVATPGDTLSTPGPLAHLSPKLTRRDLATAMKVVADWQLARTPGKTQTDRVAQVDWTWAALYAGFMAVPRQGERRQIPAGDGAGWQYSSSGSRGRA